MEQGSAECDALADSRTHRRSGSRTDFVTARIRDMIAQDILAPGQKISERALAEDLSVSRTPVREAIKLLVSEGLVTMPSPRRTRVADPTPGEIDDRLRLLAALEATAGEMAAERATDEEIAEIVALNHEMAAAYSRGDSLTYFKLNQGIHCAIVDAARCEPLTQIHSVQNSILYRVRFQSFRMAGSWNTAMAEHEGIVQALQSRDSGMLAQNLRDHLAATRRKIAALLDAEGKG